MRNVRNSLVVRQRMGFVCLHNGQYDFTKKPNKLERATPPSGPKLIGEDDTS